MAPISSTMMGRYLTAAEAVLSFLTGEPEPASDLPSLLSEVKGMLNRTVRKDQWDWFSVYTQLGEPPPAEASEAVRLLSSLRAAIKAGDAFNAVPSNPATRRLQRRLETFVRGGLALESDGRSGWVYVLSTREQPDYLKIGMTTRSVSKRVDEINRATGVPIPYSARAVYRVADAAAAERAVHQRLDAFRMRSDREFFHLEFKQADDEILDCITQSGPVDS